MHGCIYIYTHTRRTYFVLFAGLNPKPYLRLTLSVQVTNSHITPQRLTHYPKPMHLIIASCGPLPS